MTAYIFLREDPHYRIESFTRGFQRLGHHVEYGQPSNPLEPGDVALIWNKSARNNQTLQMAREGSGAVIVAENGYWGKDAQGRQFYALALNGHNGSGRWFVGDMGRMDALGIDFKPFRAHTGARVVIAGQRGIGSPQMASPGGFEDHTARKLLEAGWLPSIRPHPGRHAPTRPLMEDLHDARALVVWSSNCATEALINGIPTYYCAPRLVTAGAARMFNLTDLRQERFTATEPGRVEAFTRLAWAQWALHEIEDGIALDTLLQVHAGRLPSASPGLPL